MSREILFKVLFYIGAIAVSYLMGTLSMAYFLGEIKGKDVRSAGSRNLGASNTMIVLGWPSAILVGAHDIAKAFIAVYLARHLSMYFFGHEMTLIGVIAGVACVFGHIYPFYLKFKGGKGLAAYVGMSFALHWTLGLLACVLIAICTLVTRYIVIGTTATILLVPVATGILYKSYAIPFVMLVATAVMLYKHKGNYVRLYKGTEIPLYGTKPSQEEIDKDM